MGIPSSPGKPYRDLAHAALLRRAARNPKGQPAIVNRLPLPPPLNTPKPIRIDPAAGEQLEALPTNPRLGSVPNLPRLQRLPLPPPEPEAEAPPAAELPPGPDFDEITLGSGSVRMLATTPDDDHYLSIAMVMAPSERLTPALRRVIFVLGAVAVLLLAIWLFRRTADAPGVASPAAPTRATGAAAVPVPAVAEPSSDHEPGPAADDPGPLAYDPTPVSVPRARPAATSRTKKAPARRAAKAPPKPAAPAEFGFLTVDAVPYGTVWIDGRAAGQTPLIRVRLPAGSHDVRVVSGSGEGKSFAVDLAAGADLRRRIRFGEAP